MENTTNYIINGDCLNELKALPSESVNCCVTSPPYYGLRDYGIEEQIGREKTPEMYVERLTEIFSEIRRILTNNGTFWLNISDSYCGSCSKGRLRYPAKSNDFAGRGGATECADFGGKTAEEAKRSLQRRDPKYPKGRNGQQTSITYNVEGCKHKDLIGIPWLLAFSLRSDGWYLRSDIIWQKGNAMPENVKDRPTRSYEHIFLFSKSKKYYYDALSIAEPAITKQRNKGIGGIDFPDLRNCRDVWRINTTPYKGEHYATYPPELAERCILAGCPENGIVIDPFFGSGATGLAAAQNNRRFIGIELVVSTFATQKSGYARPHIFAVLPESCILAAMRIGEAD